MSRIAIVTMTKDPADFYAWLEWHHLIGVDAFYIWADNDDTERLVVQLSHGLNATVSRTADDGDMRQMDRQTKYISETLRLLQQTDTYVFFIDDDELILEKAIAQHISDGGGVERSKLRPKLLAFLEKRALPRGISLRNFEARCAGNCSSGGLFSNSCIFETNPEHYHAYYNGKAVAYMKSGYDVVGHGPHAFLYADNTSTPIWSDNLTKDDMHKIRSGFETRFDECVILHCDSMTYNKWKRKFSRRPSPEVADIPFYIESYKSGDALTYSRLMAATKSPTQLLFPSVCNVLSVLEARGRAPFIADRYHGPDALKLSECKLKATRLAAELARCKDEAL